jgi:DNA-binding response OmpR family regulator
MAVEDHAVTRPCIAVIDGDRALRCMTKWVLSLHGYTTIGIATAQEALAHLPARLPDLVIVDLYLERPDAGLELIHTLRSTAATAHLPIVLWSDNPEVATSVARHNLDGIVIWVKPVRPTELLQLVATLVAAR